MTIVNVRRSECTHYMGRALPPRFPVGSPLANPFHITKEHDRQWVIAAYDGYVRARPDLLALIRELPEDAVLGCWCYPLHCHCNVIAKIWLELR